MSEIDEALEREIREQTEWLPIGRYDHKPHNWVRLSDGHEEIFGCFRKGAWCSMFDGDYYPNPDFEPTRFLPVPDDEIANWAH